MLKWSFRRADCHALKVTKLQKKSLHWCKKNYFFAENVDMIFLKKVEKFTKGQPV